VAAEETPTESTRWTIHGERLVDDTRRLNLSIAHVELPDGVHFEQWVPRMPKAVMTVVPDDAREQVLMIYRHRFIMDRWTWELPGGYLDPDEGPSRLRGARSGRGDRVARPKRPLANFQPLTAPRTSRT
jgi:hypothetical protein